MTRKDTVKIEERSEYEFTCPVCGGDLLMYYIPGTYVCPVVGYDYIPEYKTIDSAIFSSQDGHFERDESDEYEAVGCGDCHYRRNHIQTLLRRGLSQNKKIKNKKNNQT